MQLLTGHLSSAAIANINSWLNESRYIEYKLDLEKMIQAGDWQNLEDAFYKKIEFGTAGCRGKTGLGSNRINKVTIGESAQGLCDYILSLDRSLSKKGIVIAYDTRLTSLELSRFTAQVVAANGIKTYIFDSFRSTPELSFAVRHLGCVAGIVISASHNPPTDNGFKAYWNDGCQMVAPHSQGLLNALANITKIKSMDYDKSVADGRIQIISKDIDAAYILTASAESLGDYRDINIVYSPLHGTGQTSVLPVLSSVGFNKISVVDDQMVPDGNFPTISSGKPNPEDKSANDMAVDQLMAEKADIAITNDPDADRIGVIVRQGDDPIYLNGNQTAILATDFALKQLKAQNKLSKKNYIVKTIVTTDMIGALVDYYGATIYSNLLIGFKYIGELILKKENTDEKFVIGCEESYGMLKGDYARDKDAATGALMLAEYAAELKINGKTLYDRLLELYAQHGLYVEKLVNMVCPGPTGFEKMKKIMANLRLANFKTIGDNKITAILDYKSLIKHDLETNVQSNIDCQSGDVIVLEFGDIRNRITIRPSGTEPKLKLYSQWFSLNDGQMSVSDQYVVLENMLEGLLAKLEEILAK